jgi:hypothetical protein
MPMGPAPAGFAYFTVIKFLGYSAYAYRLRREFHDADQGAARTFKIGGLRTGIGVVVGVSYGWLSLASGLFGHGDMASAFFLLGLLPIRIGEWLLLLRLVFKDKIQDRKLTAKSVAVGTIVSYGLDFAGIAAAFVLPGGAWVC